MSTDNEKTESASYSIFPIPLHSEHQSQGGPQYRRLPRDHHPCDRPCDRPDAQQPGFVLSIPTLHICCLRTSIPHHISTYLLVHRQPNPQTHIIAMDMPASLSGCWDCFEIHNARAHTRSGVNHDNVYPLCRTLRHKQPLTNTGPEDDEAHVVAAATVPAPPYATQTISFLDLPPELRNRIYELALPLKGRDHPLIITAPHLDQLMTLATQPSVTRLCKQVRAECLPMFYARANFAAYIHPANFQPLLTFVRCITNGPSSRRSKSWSSHSHAWNASNISMTCCGSGTLWTTTLCTCVSLARAWITDPASLVSLVNLLTSSSIGCLQSSS